MHARDHAARPGERRTDLGETRRRFLFAREHLAAHAPGARPQLVRNTGEHGGAAAGRTSSRPGA